MIPSYKVYEIRRTALGLTRSYIAEKAGVSECDVVDFEHGIKIPFVVYDKIKTAIRNEFNDLSPVEHYQKRILEISMELQIEDNTQAALQKIAHMQIELAKLQNEIIGNVPLKREDWI